MMAIRGNIKYRTRKPLGKKPPVFFTGGYSGKTKNNHKITFDWTESYGTATVLDDGYVEIEMTLRDFDWEFTINNSDSEAKPEELTPEVLSNLELTDVSYECYADENEEEFVHLDLVEFAVYDYHDKEGKVYR